ncbi:1,2-phenylacetyl-CoA epoxidase subunit PaaC [Streptomyces sp. IB2014 016-6]|uniref:1,2-phenylacetyl-CoA epoxidase subunit PaaC n=1 Tax=Streptomyces sp. IB2014 016-6 TaxID=2517818 RepID=UPI0011CB69F6|nr:1,2-phenylacetyl-CoA epoxidase subunit PaaC [Streptomyces sp. IB2014 016-6]TXL91663.1 phenylacetate-CoA oxygenase subunit PaaI [Streptomyces sp. IB2014 016-6]
MTGTPTRTGTDTAALALADDALILSHRLGEWAGHAPELEEDVALANIALDLLGQARILYSLVGDEDELAFLREERAFRNLQLVEQPNGDFAHSIARQLYFSTYQRLLYGALAAGDGPFAGLAAKAVKEVDYHQDHAEQWTLRLGDGTAESHERMQRACTALWRFTGEMFEPVVGDDDGAGGSDAGNGPDGLGGVNRQELEESWLSSITAVLERATLTVPDGPRSGAWAAGAGRQGLHTESFGRLLAEMQHLHRSHPGASW